ncbi:SRPBCC family protein [Phenylobacterium sp.]|uniref:SRPBCC family protein n=1 Tax=Phenylobacterium sp. TaxID=1871053 RepID=UPI0025EA1D54|nr:SRPBCC family protein [Phenylobacterium sp.]
MSRTVTRAQELEAPEETVFDLLRDPRNIPRWAPNFADMVNLDPASPKYTAAKAGQTFALRLVIAPKARSVDYLREIAPGQEGGAFLRVLPRPGGGSVVVMTVPVPPDGDPENVGEVLRDELDRLAKL